jgi:PhnB protein
VFPLQDQFWGDRYGQVRDPAGFVWGIATHIEDPTPEEIQQRMAQAFGASHS